MNLINSRQNTRWLALFTFISWLGAYSHNYMELQLPIYRWENLFPALMGAALFLGWWKQPERRKVWGWLLFGWTTLAHFGVGAVMSVLPLPLWPFYPEQALWHYVSHVIYGLAQLPLIWLLWKELR